MKLRDKSQKPCTIPVHHAHNLCAGEGPMLLYFCAALQAGDIQILMDHDDNSSEGLDKNHLFSAADRLKSSQLLNITTSVVLQC